MSAAVVAQVNRFIPEDAPRGTMTHLTELYVEVNGVPTELSASVRIWNADNLMIVPSALPARSLVKYHLGVNRQIERVWVLSKAEAERPDPKPAPSPDRRQIPSVPGRVTIPVVPQAPQ